MLLPSAGDVVGAVVNSNLSAPPTAKVPPAPARENGGGNSLLVASVVELLLLLLTDVCCWCDDEGGGERMDVVGVKRSNGLLMTRGVDTRLAGRVLAEVDLVLQLDDSLLVSWWAVTRLAPPTALPLPCMISADTLSKNRLSVTSR